jgi:hypothetical protein
MCRSAGPGAEDQKALKEHQASGHLKAGGQSIDRVRYIAWVKCPYRVAAKASAHLAGKRASG